MLFMDRNAGSQITERLILRRGLDDRHGRVKADDDCQQILLSDDEDKPQVSLNLSKADRKAMKRRLKELKNMKNAGKKVRTCTPIARSRWMLHVACICHPKFSLLQPLLL